jgi:predicted transcriptional regulator
MHVHACDNRFMRTTIEIKPEHRARIVELAAKRGEKGFSHVVADALDLYLETSQHRDEAVRAALSLQGCLSEAAADSLSRKTLQIRSNWR